MSISVNHGKIKKCTVLGFSGHEIWFNDDHYKVALCNIDDVRDAIGKAPVMKLKDVLDGAWTRYKTTRIKTLVEQYDDLLCDRNEIAI